MKRFFSVESDTEMIYFHFFTINGNCNKLLTGFKMSELTLQGPFQDKIKWKHPKLVDKKWWIGAISSLLTKIWGQKAKLEGRTRPNLVLLQPVFQYLGLGSLHKRSFLLCKKETLIVYGRKCFPTNI